MSLWSRFSISNKLLHLSGLIVLGFAYFDSFFIEETFNIFMQISYQTGKVLVDEFLTICDYAVEITEYIYSFFQIVYEDSLVFINDATEKFTFAISLLQDCYLLVEEGIRIGCQFGWNLLNLVSGLTEIVSSVFGFLQFLITSFKHIIQLIGSSIWFFIISVPEIIFFCVHGLKHFIKSSILSVKAFFINISYEVFEKLQDIYHFFFDIPLDSIYGLLIGIVLITIIFFKFNEIYLVISSALLSLYHFTIYISKSLWTGRFLNRTQRNNMNIDESKENDDRLCVICQSHFKEIIILPCKHLCLCDDCSVKVSRTFETCPLCRSQISGTMKVYL